MRLNMEKLEDKMAEFKINIEETPKEYVDGLILGLVHSGYETYIGYGNKEVCFQGWRDEVMS